MTYTGRCACGSITIAITGDALGTRQCWCRQCQRIATGGASHNVFFRCEDVEIIGSLASSSWPAASGNSLNFFYCPSCGTQIYGQSSARPDFMAVRLGAIDQPHDLVPQMAIWLEEAPAWAQIDPKLEQWPRQPAPPPAPA